MFNIDCYGDITAHVGDRLILDFSLYNNELENDDIVTLYLNFDNIKTENTQKPKDGIVKFYLYTDRAGIGNYSIMVTKKDNRQEVKQKGNIKVYD